MLFVLLFNLRTSISLDSLGLSQSIHVSESLISADETFEAGFFSPGNSTSQYLDIWYKNVSPLTVVWVANREKLLQNKAAGVLKLDENGVLVILNCSNNPLWSSQTSTKAANNPAAQILDSGNLVVKKEHDANDDDNFLWRSFDYPCDTFLPGMKLGWNLETGLERYLSSWRSDDDPAQGQYTIKIGLRGYPQFFVLEGSAIKTRPGSWNGMALTGCPTHQLTQDYRYEFVIDEKEVYYEYTVLNRLIFYIFRVSPSGVGQRLLWTSQTKRKVISNVGDDPCEKFALCGPYSVRNLDGNSPSCECLQGFAPKFPEQWNVSYWSNGCARETILACNDTDSFLKYTGMKLPDTSSSWYDKAMTLEECRNSCLKNCSCSAFANLDIRNGGSGCLLWFGDLIDMKKFSEGGQDICIRVPNSVLEHAASNGHGNKKSVGIIVGVVLFVLTTCACLMIIKRKWVARSFFKKHYMNKLMKEEIDLPTFDLSTIAKATDNFSIRNKLGEGGYGPVYKGTLADGQELAVKRLSKKSRQGSDEFKNEVMLIARLQHRNLVKLLGCCIQAKEKMLIYEFMPNKSLDYFIFDENKRKLLDWSKRFNIISGIARGLVYLHQDSRLKIIHRNLKTSNILLDTNIDPKISDFGLTRIFLGDQVEANTNRVVGTYGYMPPEYAVHGHFSMKSDVYSYGVIILETVSGKRNKEFSDPEHYHNHLGKAWRLWTDARPLELLDEVLRENCNSSEAIRCIQVGLLCVQQRPEDRPNMSSVVLMLNGEKSLPKPKVPGFYTERDVQPEAEFSPTNCNMFSVNEISITMLDAR